MYTSGTTGRPKGAVHTHRSLLAGAQALRVAWGWQPDDRLILTLPLFHVHGLCAGLFGTLAAGASTLVFERFDVGSTLDAVPQGSMFFGVPTMYHRLAASGRAGELSALRLCVSGSGPLPAELWRSFHGEHRVDVLERYGMSETLLTLSNPLAGERRPGSVGLPLPGVTATIAGADEHGVGELMVRGSSLCRGYWERPEASASSWREGWFATGDLASVETDGYYSIRGRRTELIITGGHNVYPAEVESVLGRHASVAEIAVVGMRLGGVGRVRRRLRGRRRGRARPRRAGPVGGAGADALQATPGVPGGGRLAPQRHGQGRPPGSAGSGLTSAAIALR